MERGCPEADVVSVRGSHTRQEVTIYEVKASRADWTKEMRSGKWQSYLPFCHRLVFACPAGLVEQSEVPDGTGLMCRNDNGWYGAVKADRHECLWEQDAYSLALGLLFSIGNQEATLQDEQQRVSSLLHNVQWHVDYKRLRRELGQEIARLIMIAREVDHEHNLVQRIETIESNLRGVARELGIQPSHAGVGGWIPRWSEWDVGERLRVVVSAETVCERAMCWLADECPPVDDYPVVVPSTYRRGDLRCERCSVRQYAHRRRACWRTWLASLTPEQWRVYAQEHNLF